jgi:hypothetical protein
MATFDEIHAHRVAAPGRASRSSASGWKSLPGRDVATVNLEFKIRSKDLVGRQSQTWSLRCRLEVIAASRQWTTSRCGKMKPVRNHGQPRCPRSAMS